MDKPNKDMPAKKMKTMAKMMENCCADMKSCDMSKCREMIDSCCGPKKADA
jgi:hypothetical protein